MQGRAGGCHVTLGKEALRMMACEVEPMLGEEGVRAKGRRHRLGAASKQGLGYRGGRRGRVGRWRRSREVCRGGGHQGQWRLVAAAKDGQWRALEIEDCHMVDSTKKIGMQWMPLERAQQWSRGRVWAESKRERRGNKKHKNK